MRAAAAAVEICQRYEDSKTSQAYLQLQLGHWMLFCRQCQGSMGSFEARDFDFVLLRNVWWRETLNVCQIENASHQARSDQIESALRF